MGSPIISWEPKAKTPVLYVSDKALAMFKAFCTLKALSAILSLFFCRLNSFCSIWLFILSFSEADRFSFLSLSVSWLFINAVFLSSLLISASNAASAAVWIPWVNWSNKSKICSADNFLNSALIASSSRKAVVNRTSAFSSASPRGVRPAFVRLLSKASICALGLNASLLATKVLYSSDSRYADSRVAFSFSVSINKSSCAWASSKGVIVPSIPATIISILLFSSSADTSSAVSTLANNTPK